MAEVRTGITVAEVASLLHLRVDVLAGAGGLDRPIAWAHAVDNPHPWDWLDPGALVMTSGWIIPEEPEAQRTFIERMAAAGLAGLFTGEDPKIPPLRVPELSREMLEAADRLDFPVLWGDMSTSWTEVSRMVVRANLIREGRMLNVILRVHDKVRGWLASPGSSQELLDALGDVVEARISAIDSQTGERLLPGTTLDPVWVEALREALAARADARPISIRLAAGERSATAVQFVLERTRAFVVAESTTGEAPRVAVLQHVAAACALEIARVDAAFHEQLWSGAAILSEALQGLLHPTALAAALDDRGIEPPFDCIALDAPFDVIDRLNRSWLVRGESHLMTRAGSVTILLHHDEARLADVRAIAASEHVRAGVSEAFAGPHGLSDASQQARWALETIPPGTAGVALYGADAHSFLPRTLLESQHAVERILGPLVAYDAQHGSELVRTLQVYLDCDRSPKQAAAQLFVHNQTIHYRLARIQELTGRSLRSTADISDLWFALRALALSQTAPVGR